MRATPEHRARLQAEAQRLADQLKAVGAVKVILFGSLARDDISLFSDIDLLALFEGDRSARDLSRWVYQNIDTGESVDVIAYNLNAFELARQRPFFRHILQHSKVLYERPHT